MTDGKDSNKKHLPAFTLVELLVCIAVIAILLAVLMPALSGARRSAQTVVCGSNLRQIAFANIGYAGENADSFVPAAPDIWEVGGGLARWHGARSVANPEASTELARFDGQRGPLARYLPDSRIRTCPAFSMTLEGTGVNAYELGSGGYGYSQMYVGSRFWADGYYYQSPGTLRAALTSEIRQPATKVMFTDVAMPQSRDGGTWFTEESFCSPPFFLDESGAARDDWGLSTPTIHFRHDGKAQAAWCDGHVEDRRMTFTLESPNVYGADSRAAGVGWFGSRDNAAFCIR